MIDLQKTKKWQELLLNASVERFVDDQVIFHENAAWPHGKRPEILWIFTPGFPEMGAPRQLWFQWMIWGYSMVFPWYSHFRKPPTLQGVEHRWRLFTETLCRRAAQSLFFAEDDVDRLYFIENGEAAVCVPWRDSSLEVRLKTYRCQPSFKWAAITLEASFMGLKEDSCTELPWKVLKSQFAEALQSRKWTQSSRLDPPKEMRRGSNAEVTYKLGTFRESVVELPSKSWFALFIGCQTGLKEVNGDLLTIQRYWHDPWCFTSGCKWWSFATPAASCGQDTLYWETSKTEAQSSTKKRVSIIDSICHGSTPIETICGDNHPFTSYVCTLGEHQKNMFTSSTGFWPIPIFHRIGLRENGAGKPEKNGA